MALRKIILVLLAVAAGNMAIAQNKIKGTVKDSLDGPLPFATVILLQAGDSIMYQFTTTNDDGKFELKAVKAGDYILQLSFTGYNQYIKNINVSNNVSLGNIIMKPRDIRLDEFAVEEELIPIKVKEDTIEYNADAFTTQPNAKVEDLLKQLPGVEVDKSGEVKAQGETVTRVLVEGKEFFGDDPKTATKNLPADAIDKVQVFDKMSDMSEFSGVDDGDRTKTINLTLKEGKKKGYFGYFTGGYGTEDRYESKMNLNRFGKKTQISAIGMANNINDQGFSFDDYISFMGGMGNMMKGGGGRSSFNQAGVPLGSGLGDGLVNTGAGGINLSTEFSKKTDLQSSYFFTHIDNDLTRGIDRQNFLGELSYDSYDSTEQETSSNMHRINIRLKHKLDSSSDLTLLGNGKYNMGNSSSYAEQYTYNTENVLENSGITNNKVDGTGLSFTSAATYRKKFKTKGRTFTTRVSVGMNNDDQESGLNSLNSFLDDDSLFTWMIDTNKQNQYLINDRLNYSVKVDYTEPIGKRKYLQFNYSYANNNYDYKKDFYDVSDNIEVFNNLLSNQYTNLYNYNKGGVKLMWSKKKMNLTIGTDVQLASLDGDLITTGAKIDKQFTTILPNIKFVNRFTNSKRISARYSTSMNEPSIAQLNPVVDNSDPFDLSVGNPDLKPEYRHRLNLHFMSFNQFSFTNIFIGLFGTYTTDKITNAVFVDSSLIQTSMPINTAYDMNITNYINFSTPLRFIKAKINLNGNIGYNQGIVFVNTVENTTDRWTTSIDVRLENRKKDKVDIAIGADVGNNLTTYSVSSSLDQKFTTVDYYADFLVYIGKKMSFGTSFDYTIYSGEAFDENTAVPILKANLSFYCLKDNKGQLRLHAFDLLNKNQGINRTTNLNYIEEERVNTLQRYFLVSFTYSLSGFGGKPGKSSNNKGWHGGKGRR